MVDDGLRVYSVGNEPVEFTCFFWQNCKDNSCVSRSEGFICERCEDNDYYRSSAICTECLTVPVSILVAVLFILLTIYGLIRKGISASQLTQLKLLVNFVQILSLTLWTKVNWNYNDDNSDDKSDDKSDGQSSLTVYTIDALNVVNLNFEIFHFDCFWDIQDIIYYLEWFSSVIIPFLCIGIGGVVDYVLHRKMKSSLNGSSVMNTRKHLRRFLIFLLLLWYAPATQLSLRSYICESNIPLTNASNDSDSSGYRYADVDSDDECRDKWLYNGDVCCTDALMQVITVLSTIVLASYSIGFPAGILFFTARAMKFKKLYKHHILYGGLYESFREKWSFMEAVIMLRKFILIISTDLLPINPIYLACLNLVLSLVYLIIVIFGRPYSGWKLQLEVCSYGVYNFLEIISAEVICVVQLMAILLAAEVSDKAMDYTMVTLIAMFLFIWMIFYLFNVLWKDDDDDQLLESQVEELQSNEEGETNRTSRFGWKKLFRSNKIVDEPIKSEEMERRQHAFEDL